MRVIIFCALAALVGCSDGSVPEAAATGGAGGQTVAATGGTGGHVMMMTATGGVAGAAVGTGGTGGSQAIDAGTDAQTKNCAALTPVDITQVVSVTKSFSKYGQSSPTSCSPTSETANIVNGVDVNEPSWTASGFNANGSGSTCTIDMYWTGSSPSCGTITAVAIFTVQLN